MTDEPVIPTTKKKPIDPNLMISTLQAEADYRRIWAYARTGEYAQYLHGLADIFERAADIVAWARNEAELRKAVPSKRGRA